MASGSQSFCDVFAAGSGSNSINGRKVNVLPRVRGVSEKQREVPDAIEDARSVIQEASATIGPPTAIDAEIHPILPASSSLSWHTFVKNSATNSPWHGQEEGCVNNDDDSAANDEDDDGVAEEDAQRGDAELHEEDIDNEDPTVKVDVFVRSRSEMSQKVQDEYDVHVLPSPEPSEVASVSSSGENNVTVKENYDLAEPVDNKEVPKNKDTSADEPQAHVEDELRADIRSSSSDKEPISATASATKKSFGIAGLLKRKARMNDTRKSSTTVEGAVTPHLTSTKDNGLLKLRRRVRMLGGSKKSSKKKIGGGGKKKKAMREDLVPLSPIKESTGEEPKSSPIMATIEKNETVSTVPSTPVKKKASTGSGGALATIIVTPIHQVAGDDKTAELDDTPTTTTSVSSLELSPSPIKNGANSPACTLEMPRAPPAMPAAESASASGSSSSSDSSSSASSSNCSSTDDEASSAKDSSCNMAFPRVSTFLSQEGQEATSIFTIPNPQPAMSTFAEEEEETDITEEVLVQAMNYYANSEKLQVLLKQKAAEEQVAVREVEKLVQEEDDGSNDAEVEDADTVVDECYNEEVDGEDVSVHVIYDDEQHGVIGSSKDVLVEVSSTAEGHAGDIEVIKCMGLEDIGLEVAATRDYETTNHDVDLANNEEADEEEDIHQVEQDSIKQNSRSTKQSDKTKKSTTTANTEGTSKTGTSSSTGRKSLASRLSRGRVREAANNSKSSHNENGQSKSSRTKGRGRSKRVPRKGRFSLKKKTSSVSDNDDTVSRKGLSSEAKKAVDDADSAHQPADEIILTAVETPVLGSDNRYGLSEEAREALACDYEPKEIKPNKNTPGLSQNARHALAVEKEAEEELEDDLEEIEVDVRASRNPRGKRSERITVSRKIRHSRSTQSYADESTIGGESLAYASYASEYETVDEESTFYEEESYDDASRSFVSYDDRSGYETKEENFVFGIPHDELIEDLKEAFADTTAHIQNMITASLNFTESIVLDQMINNDDSERERNKRREASNRQSAAASGDRRQSHPDSRRRSNRDEQERRSKRSDAERRKSKQASRLRVEV